MEISVPLILSPEEESLVDMHSVLNVLNVVNFEILEIGVLLDASDEADLLMDEVADAAEMLKNPTQSKLLVAGIEGFVGRLEAALDAIELQRGQHGIAQVKARRENLRNIFRVIQVRAGEIQSRFEAKRAWVEHDISDLKSRFDQFLQAVEKNSHGGYRIVRNLADKHDRDYLINFELTSEEGESLWMPIVFQDVMRDILANARKYTRPGGKINGGLHFGGGSLRYVVEDTGIGISPDEIEDVIRFGYRGANVSSRPTRGGGFGLTKAYWVTRQHNGRMWIDSSPDGTRVEIKLPVPVEVNGAGGGSKETVSVTSSRKAEKPSG
ncbi:ATP-binding protein [Pelagicoccus sp. SDUM812003]|uniref:sensor histidine kinase n=1 Tax=Pelagicoccus sp. SDUM812003 TaxID=3041267 RepID=UPI00280DB3C3|nr:ATP-binding protein [Pelagicoccus sp. SDUM812003]MDQ8205301.1 ATP-binding protein [Pelagicoccus sp. SDUM812003]